MAETKGRSSGSRHAQPSRRLAAIMFTDLVGYSALAHRDEALAIELLELHRGWVRDILPRHGGIEIETVGDAFLIEFAGALAAVECAVAIQRRFAEHNAAASPDRRMELRVGIHLGDVEHKGDKVMGDGVNIASRIHGMAKPGGICVSEDVQHAVRNRPAFQFTSLGSPPLKNIAAPLELFELAPSLGLAPPAAITVASPRTPDRRRWLLGAGAVAAAAIVVALAAAYLMRPPHDALPAIAVLPFDNLSADADSAFFTDGLHDTVIGHLARVRGLKVISRTSVMGYRGQHSNLRQIARELGVGNILEGSVQRAGGRLRVAAQLIDTATDAHLWSSEYDRDMADVFAVQADIARNVAAAVNARLTSAEQASIESIPTRNQAAYDLYLRAVLVERTGDRDEASARQAINWLDEAIRLDPDFALAHALLATMHDQLYWFGHDPSDARKLLVEQSAATALRLAPGLAEAHVARALHLYHGSRSYELALRELEIARGIEPGNARVHAWLGFIYRRQGRWDEAVATNERAIGLDPLNASYLRDQAETLQFLRRYAEADAILGRFAHIDGAKPLTPATLAYNRFLQNGDIDAVYAALAAVPPDFNPGCELSGWRGWAGQMTRRFDEVLAAIAACPQPFLGVGGSQLPREYFVAQARWLAGGRRTPPEAAKARHLLEAEVAARPDGAQARMALAFTMAMQGERRQAVAEADRALAVMPLSRDAVTGVFLLRGAAEVRANAGAEEQALTELEQAMRLPGGGHVEELKLDPILDPLRAHPRFQRLIAG